MHTCAGHDNKWRYLSSELCITKMYTLFLLMNCPEHSILVQSDLYPKEINSVTKFPICYDYLRTAINCGVGMPTLHMCCGYISFNAVNNVERHSYLQSGVGRSCEDALFDNNLFLILMLIYEEINHVITKQEDRVILKGPDSTTDKFMYIYN